MSEPTPFDDFFRALEGALGVPVLVGEADASAGSTEPRITVERAGDPTYESIPYRVPGERTIGRLAHPFAVTIYGATDDEVANRLADFCYEVDRLVGPPQGTSDIPDHHGYVFKAGAVKGIAGDDAVAASYACGVSLTLRTPVSKVRRTARGRVSLTIAPASPEALTSTPIEVP